MSYWWKDSDDRFVLRKLLRKQNIYVDGKIFDCDWQSILHIFLNFRNAGVTCLEGVDLPLLLLLQAGERGQRSGALREEPAHGASDPRAGGWGCCWDDETGGGLGLSAQQTGR